MIVVGALLGGKPVVTFGWTVLAIAVGVKVRNQHRAQLGPSTPMLVVARRRLRRRFRRARRRRTPALRRAGAVGRTFPAGNCDQFRGRRARRRVRRFIEQGARRGSHRGRGRDPHERRRLSVCSRSSTREPRVSAARRIGRSRRSTRCRASSAPHGIARLVLDLFYDLPSRNRSRNPRS